MRIARVMVGWCWLLASVAGSWGAIDFNREIRPILSDVCFHCHGPDEQAREASLRLDTKEGALGEREGGGVIVPGKAAESELIKRITSKDPDEVMPPREAPRQLSAEQIARLTQWVNEGAKWETHWAFQPMAKPALPKVAEPGWVKNEIDRFILARLEQEQIKPAEPATRERLLRRAALDLTGIAPTIEELDEFLNDSSTNAFSHAVDRLLASKRYGERMAADWMDISRFADTHGYQMDRYRPMWVYRDWVIKAFNENLPWDKFTTWQLAGDLLPNATKEQRLATAFNRLHSQTEEGGVIEEEFRVTYVVDRVNTFGTAFLGLTFECSRCHDHKYDPITMKDFYSMFSFFQNIDESGQTVYFADTMPVPTMLLTDEKADGEIARIEQKIKEKEAAVQRLGDHATPYFEDWLKQKGEVNFARLPGQLAEFDFNELKDNKVVNRLNDKQSANAVEGPKLVAGVKGQGIALDGENGFTFPGLGHFTRADPFTLGLWVKMDAYQERAVVLHHSKAPIDAGSRGYELLLENGRVAFGLHHMWPGNSVKVRSSSPIPTNSWVQLTIVYDGSSRAEGIRIYLGGEALQVETIRDYLYREITYDNGEPDLAIGYRFRDSGFKGGMVDEFSIFNRALAPLEVAQLAGREERLEAVWKKSDLSENERKLLLDYYLQNHYPLGVRLYGELRGLRAELNRLTKSVPEAMVMHELAKPKPAHILKRGAYDAPGDPVAADTPGILPPFPTGAPRNRLGLAQWLTAPDNPLMARVTVNRAWQQMFGTGLVQSSDNFGIQGTTPSHPELLDWLAQRFIASGWDMKALLKLIAMSATYQQSSRASAELLARDSSNLLLARAPARRLTAEMLRDNALALSGLLVEKIGGPSVKPYQPDGLWEEIAMGKPRYDTGKGDDLYRRSLYTYWKRTVPPPTMVLFDAADRSNCSVKRQNTSTPLQALSLLNDPLFFEPARFFAQRLLKEGGAEIRAQAEWGFRRATGRKPSAREVDLLATLYTEQRAHFAKDPAAALKLLAVGEGVADPGFAPVELAAATVLANAILNHDEAIMRR